MPKSNFFCGRNAFFFGSRFCSAVLFSQVPKKCTDLDRRLLYNLILGTYSKFACKNNCLSLCARRSHHRAALLRTLQWLLKFSKKIRRGCRKKQVGVLKRRVFRQCHFPIRHHEVFWLRSRSDVHDANLWEHSRIRSCEIMCQEVSIWRDNETIQHDVGKLYMMGQANSREKALSQCNKWLSGWNHLYIVTSSHEPTSGHVMMSYSKKQWKTDGRDQ